jgi:probable phosphoglycerate mutase
MAIEHPFYFMRHGQTFWNARGQTQGQLDSALSPEGRAQADEAARRLARETIDRIVSSPLSRVRETAERVAHFHRLEVEYDPTLMECHLGAAQGQQHGPWLREYWKGGETPDGAEPFEQFAERAYGALRRIVTGPNVLVVAHGGILRALQAFVRVDPEPSRENALPILIEPGRPAWKATPLLSRNGVDNGSV